jgi:hypothetical protein
MRLAPVPDGGALRICARSTTRGHADSAARPLSGVALTGVPADGVALSSGVDGVDWPEDVELPKSGDSITVDPTWAAAPDACRHRHRRHR